MTMSLALAKSVVISKEIQVVAHFKAQPNKKNDLKINLEKMAKMLIGKANEGLEDPIEYKITAGGNDVVEVEIRPPMPESGNKLEQQAETDLANSLKEYPHPTMQSTIAFGRTLDEMNDNLDMKLFEVFNGVMLKESAAISTGLMAGSLEMMQADMAAQSKEVPPQLNMAMQFLLPFVKSLEAMKSRTEILYKQDTTDA